MKGERKISDIEEEKNQKPKVVVEKKVEKKDENFEMMQEIRFHGEIENFIQKLFREQ